MSSIAPTIGRKVWFFQSARSANVLDNAQPFDASIAFVHPSGNVNLAYVDHLGVQHAAYDVDLVDPQDGHEHGKAEFATWMPYQVGQAKAPAAAPTPEAPPAPEPQPSASSDANAPSA